MSRKAKDLDTKSFESDDDEDQDEEDEEVESENEMEPEEDVVDDLQYDVFNLAAFNYHTIKLTSTTSPKEVETTLTELAERSTQLLVNKIFHCPVERTDLGPVVVLPEQTSKLPREKRVPDPKPETRWERFAKDKGIKKKKRDRMIWDEDQKEFRPRYGYKRANNGIQELPIVEVKQGQDAFADPWEEERKSKKEKIQKNLKNQQNNLLRTSGKLSKRSKGKSDEGGSFESSRIPGIPIDIDDRGGGVGGKGLKRGKEGVKSALQLVQQSTASMGRFDELRSGEPKPKMKGKRRAFRDNMISSDKEKASLKTQLNLVSDIVDKKRRGVTNSLAPYEGILPDSRGGGFKQKKGKGKGKGVNHNGGGSFVDGGLSKKKGSMKKMLFPKKGKGKR